MRRMIYIVCLLASCCLAQSAATARLGALVRNDLVVTNVDFSGISVSLAPATNYTDNATNALATGPIYNLQQGVEGIGSRVSGLESYAATKDGLAAAALAATNYTDAATNALAAVVDGKVSATNESRTAYVGWDGDIFRFSYGIRVDASPIMLPSYLGGVYFGEQTLLDILDERSLAATNYTDASISTNNAAFVSAVTNCPVVIAAADGTTMGEFGEYGTLGSLLAALAAAITWLKTNKASKAELPYPFVPAVVEQGVATVSPRTVATYTAGSSAASFTVAVGTGVTGAARDCVLVVDCTATGAVAPTVTWPSNFHPRTDAEEIAPVAGVRNVFYISEYATGQFVVGGWHEEVA